MQITIPDDRNLRDRALAAGFATVEEYLLELVERDSRQGEVPFSLVEGGREEPTDEEWINGFRSFLRSLPSRNSRFDDSRESIYPVR